jgi:Zn-dependent protease
LDDLQYNILRLIPLILSLTVHEWAHAISAYKLGDDTAEREGRLTLNPIPHIDPIGTLLLPLFSPIPFGWAKPVPVVPTRFRRDVTMRTGMMITAAAGPVSNIILAFVCMLMYGIALRFFPHVFVEHEALQALLTYSVGLNISLAVFNALPIPPLDGSRIVDGVMPYRYRDGWERFARFAPLLLLGMIVFPGSLSFMSGPMRFIGGTIERTAMWMVGLS